MRFAFAIILFLSVAPGMVHAQIFGRRQVQRWPRTESELMHKLLAQLTRKDTAGYYDLFPPLDTMWHMVMHNADKSPTVQAELNNLREHPQTLIEFDPLYNKDIIGRFCKVLAKGEDSGLNWNYAVMARYQLHKQEPTRALIGLEHIMPERFAGHMFVSDGFNRVVFCISVAEIQKIKGQFFGGQVLNILEANSVDEFRVKEAKEQEYFEWLAAHPDTVLAQGTVDSTRAEDTATDDPLAIKREEAAEDDDARKEVVERRYYEGLMDNEIPIRMYVRYMRQIPGKAQQFDGLYKLGDNRKYVKLEVVRTKDGKWIIEDENAIGTMELLLNGRTYTGQWTNADENGFDIVMSQTGTVKGKIETLDAILDRGRSGKVDESQFEEEAAAQEEKEKEETKEKKDEKKKDSERKKNRKKNDKKARKLKRQADN